MDFLENIRIALRALGANKMRSALTMLGIIIGVGAVVGLLAIGNGAAASITSDVQGIGSNLIQVIPGEMQTGMGRSSSSTAVLSMDDYELLADNLKNTAGIAPVAQIAATVTYANASDSQSVTATTPDYLTIRNREILRGRALTAADGERAARVAVIGTETARQVFDGLNPIGRSLKINGVQFEVVGLLVEQGGSGFGSADEIILIPLETGFSRLLGTSTIQSGQRTVNSILVSAADPELLDTVTGDIERLLRREHNLGIGVDNDFSIFTQQEILATLGTITTTLQVFLGAIAGISLLVGGIGIMNIMLVSVTERTREIGLRKAVGARKNVILGQFLTETLVLSVFGGLLGILFGVGIGAITTATGMLTAQVTWESIAMAFGFSALIGLFFGIYPAYRAASLRPIEALRYE
ncbi:MAG TPA: ABC transporter permease [Anaerolineales bacterium]|nr:ABC transporter permease [Anaerolineales bacterium]